MEPIEFRNIAYILAVSEEHSFSRAAEKYYISQPALSKAVSKVEQQLGIVLFDRGSFPLRLTSEGQQVIEYFRRIQSVQTELSDYCEAYHRQKKSEMRIGAPSFFCTYILPPLITAFREEHPEVSIRLIETNAHDLKEFLRAGVLDLGLSVESDGLAELDFSILQYEQIILAVPRALAVNHTLSDCVLTPENLKNGRFSSADIPGAPLGAFADEKFLFLRKGNDLYQRGYRACRDAGFEPQIVMELDQMLTAYYLAEAGQGITFIRSSLPCYAGIPENLLFYKVDHSDMRRPVMLLRGKGGAENGVRQLFLSYLESHPLFT